ncbi:MAG: autotransporter-associated beta strand repeat-containing protein [Thermoguttaceae bacterium]|nr:autotransporter-associated beta strand repeat-containing protein [Thermoguttaceae bacterium]
MTFKFHKNSALLTLALAFLASSLNGQATTTYPDPNTLTENTTYTINSDETYTGAVNGGTTLTLTKEGTGTMNFTPTDTTAPLMNVNLTINAGKVSLNTAFLQNSFFSGGNTLTINNGGEFVTTQTDALGWKAISTWYININEGGVMDHTVSGNESWANARITLNGGELRSTGNGAYHMLEGTKISVIGETPSTISGNLCPRNSAGLEINVSEGSQLNFTGTFVNYGGGGLVKKTGAGTMVMNKSGGFQNAFQLQEGTLRVTGTILASSSGLTVSNGATLEIGTNGNVASPLNIGSGSIVNFTDSGTISGLLTISSDVDLSVPEGKTISLTGGSAGNYALSTSGGAKTVLGGDHAAQTININTEELELAGNGSIATTVVWNGTGTLKKTGTGVFSISKDAEVSTLLDNSISIEGGTLEFDVAAAQTLAGNITVASGANLGVNNSGTEAVTFTAAITGGGGLRKSGTGDVIVTQTGIAKLVAGEGTLQAGDASTSIGTTSSLFAEDGANLKFYVSGDDTVTLSGDKLATAGTGTLTKYGTGTLALTCAAAANYVNGNLVIEEGTLKTTTTGGALQFRNNAVLTIKADATLNTAAHDSLGYTETVDAGATTNHYTINLYGTWKNTAGNESIRNCNINLYGGTITFTTGQFDILTKNVTFTAKALEGATETNPTVSTMNSPMALRETMAANTNLTLAAEANAELDLTGNISTSSAANKYGITKTGDGVVVLNGGALNHSGTTLVQDGTLRLKKKLSATSEITVSDGATLDLFTGGSQSQPVTIAGTGHNAIGALYFSDSVTSSGALTLTADATVGVAEGKTGSITGGITGPKYSEATDETPAELIGNYTLTSTGAGTLSISGDVTANLAGSNLALNGTGSLSGSLTVPADATIQKTGDGVFTLTGDLSELKGTATVQAGTLSIQSATNDAAQATVASGAVLELDPGAGNTQAFNWATSGTSTDSIGKLNVASGTITRDTTAAIGTNLSLAEGSDFKWTVNSATTFAQNFSGAGTLEKYGTGTLTLTKTGSTGVLEIHEGEVKLTTQSSNGFFNGAKVYIYDGATLNCAIKDSLGYNTPACDIYVYGGTLLNSNQNETLGYQRVHLKNGTMKSMASDFDLLTTSLKIISEAETGATAENPTVSYITAPLKFRSNLGTAGGCTFETQANTRLEISGALTQDAAESFTKTGAGTLAFLSETSAYSGKVFVNEGTFEFKDSSLADTADMIVANGATIKPIDAQTIGTVTLNGTTALVFKATGADLLTNKLTVTNGTIASTADFRLINDGEEPLNVLAMDGLELFTATALDEPAPQTLGVSFDPAIFEEIGINYSLTAVWQPNRGEGGSYVLQVALPEPASWMLLLFSLTVGFFLLRGRILMNK